MSPFRTPNSSTSPRKSHKIKLAATTFALVAAAGGAVSAVSVGAGSEPAAGARQVYSVHAAELGATARQPFSVGHQQAVLDAFTAAKAKTPAQGGTSVRGAKKRPVRLTPKQIARAMLKNFGWRKWQFKYLNYLWSRESSWNVHASNPYSGAYGIPQAVPGSKMATAGPNWARSAHTQIRWGLRYIKRCYRSPYWAWQHELDQGWY